MDFWKSDYEAGDTTSVLAGLQDYVDSPHSSNSLESSSDSLISDQIESFKTKSTPTSPKTALLAKKRLQAYYTANKFKAGNSKEEKSVDIEEAPKATFKKSKKTVYPDEAQKAVIRDIEILKKSGYGYCGPLTSSPILPKDIMVPSDAFVPISLAQTQQSESSIISLIADEGNNTFKKREIKCRNIRKSGTYRRRSISPKTKDEKGQKKEKKKYPKNWIEYKELGLNPQKDASLKSKLSKKSKNRKFDFQQYFTFETSPVPTEAFKCKSKIGDASFRVPFSYLRCTASKPRILYSTNQVVPPGHLTRDQLFALISKEGKLIIEKLGKSSRHEPKSSNITIRKWYPKNWRKSDNSEAKLLEKSVGLSFLQSYSDEEEEEETKSADFADLNDEEVIGKVADIIRENICVNFDGGSKESNEKKEKEEFTPPAAPAPAPKDSDKDSKKGSIKTKKSRWDDLVDIVGPSDYMKTPPIEEKEEGEVLTEEEELCEETLSIDEYEKTKEELEKLEAVLKCSNADYVETVDVIKKVPKIKQTDKKKRKKLGSNKIAKQKGSKKRSKKRKQEKKQKVVSSTASEASESEEKVKKKKKQKNKKRDSKRKSEKDNKSKPKDKKLKKKKANEDLDQICDLEANMSKKEKKRKKKLSQETRKRTVSSDSQQTTKVSDRKNSADITAEDYEDDIRFFAARFDAENKLKGKSKHKTKTNISLEELTAEDPKLKASESETSTLLLSPDITRKKNKEESAKKSRDRDVEEPEKKDEIKIDLLKLNDDYLREQKRKEEMSVAASEESGLQKIEEQQISSTNDEIKEKTIGTNNENDSSDKSAEVTVVTLDNPVEEKIEEIKLPDDDVDDAKSSKNISEDNHPNWEEIRNKRKRRRSDKVGEEASDKKFRDDVSIIEDIQVEAITLTNIKKEKDAEIQLEQNEKDTSWETDEELLENLFSKDTQDLEIPLNIKAFHRREIKEEEEIIIKEKQQHDLDMELNNDKNTKRNLDFECINLDCDVETPTKKRRWDIKSCDSSTPIKLQKPDEIIDLDTNSCVALENEYEEFMKAVTSTKQDSQYQSIIIDSNSDSSVTIIDESNPEEPASKPPIDIAAIQIPLPPVKTEPIKPVPVPSPKLEAVLELNKPLINLSLSANVTQNITLSLATSIPSFSAPITSSIDISKPSLEISAPLSDTDTTTTATTLVSMHGIPFPLNQTSVDITNSVKFPIPASSEETFTINRLPAEDNIDAKKLVFTSLSLPAKKLLVDNSKLNLDDSDNDDLDLLEEMKRKKLEALIEDNKREALNLKAQVKKSTIAEAELPVVKFKSSSSKPITSKEDASHKSKRNPKPSSSIRRSRDSPTKRRDPSPRRRLLSPRRRSPKRRSPVRKKKSPGRRSISPRRRRNSSVSPRRRRSPSPRRKRSPSPRRHRSPSPKAKRSSATNTTKPRSPPPINQRETSPLKRSLADSTISDDQLPQTNNYFDSIPSPKRVPLDIRINQVLGYEQPREASPKPAVCSNAAEFYPQHHQHYQFIERYSNIQSQVTSPTSRNVAVARTAQSTYKQVGNMLQIVPTEDNLTDIPMPRPVPQTDVTTSKVQTRIYKPIIEQKQMPPTPVELRPQILQVGNMLQIVPTEMVPTELIPVPPVQPEIKIEKPDDSSWLETSIASPCPEKPSAEASMLLKVVERRVERENRRQEREKRRKEKEKRRKEKEKARQAKMKVKTENMIKRALELEEEEEEEAESDSFGDHHMQWPPMPIIVTHSVYKEAGKSILLNASGRQFDDSFDEKRSKIVQFADGIRPGEGTSPSAGEDLSSPPPPKKKLPKEKRYKKLKFGKKNAKKKVKVKIIKKQQSPLDESDSDDNLPPPSPPPGSPPPHIFPPRIKVKPVNNVPAAYLASIIQTAQHQQQLQQQQQQQPQLQPPQYQSSLYRSSINMLMAPPPPLPQSHLSAVQSPHGVAMPPALSPQSHYHPGLAIPPPPPPPPTLSSGHNRHY